MKSFLAIAVVGLACGGAAGQSVTLHFDLDGDLFNTAEVAAGAEPVTWTVFASFTTPDPTGYFGGYVGDFVPAGDAVGTIRNVDSLLGGHTTPRIDGLAIENINIFNNYLQSPPDPSNPIPIFSFDFEADAASLLGGSSSLSYDAEGIASVFPDDFIFTLPIEFAEFAVVSDVLIVPGPGAMSALLLGVMASRRGRHSGQRTV